MKKGWSGQRNLPTNQTNENIVFWTQINEKKKPSN